VTCAFERQLSAYIDGELELREMARLRDHLDACRSCACAEAELRKLVSAVGALPMEAEPPPGQFTLIAARLDLEERPGLSRWSLRVSLATGLVAAAAALVLVVVRRPQPRVVATTRVAETSLLADARHEFQQAEEHYEQAARTLRAIAERDRRAWRPELARAFDDNLRTIDEAIERYRVAARKNDADPIAMDNLFAAYRRQIDFLREAIDQGAAGAHEMDPL